MAVTITPITGNVNKAGTFTSFPEDDPKKVGTDTEMPVGLAVKGVSVAADGTVTTGGAPLYYDATRAGGDPSWPALQENVLSPLEGQNNLRYTRVLLETDADFSTCNWELYALKEATVGGAVDPQYPMAMTAFLKRGGSEGAPGQKTLGFRAGRKLLADDGSTKYGFVPLYQDYPVPVFKRVNGPRVVVELPVPPHDPTGTTAYNYVIDLFLPGKTEPEANVDQINVETAADGTVTVKHQPNPAPAGGGVAPPVVAPPAGTGGTPPGGAIPPAGPDPNDLTATNGPAAGAADFAALAGPPVIAATPNTAWTTGQFVTIGDGSKAHWDGAAWVAGAADEPDVGTDEVTIAPTMANTKQEIVDYLLAGGATQDELDGLTKAELLDLV